MTGDSAKTDGSRWARRGFLALVALWAAGVAVALPRYFARRRQEHWRGEARAAEAEQRPKHDADFSDAAPALLLLGLAWGLVGALIWLWRRVESEPSDDSPRHSHSPGE